MSRTANEVTTILAAIKRGEENAADELMPIVYNRLRRLAQQMMGSEKPGQTLQATALVHEAYLRLLGDGQEATSWQDRRHFYAAAAQAMRRILVERARRYSRIKHGGGRKRLALDDVEAVIDSESVDLLAVDESLRRLEKEDARAAQVVMLRYFAGLSVEDTAQALEIAPRTVRRDWTYAKAWLMEEMSHDEQ